MTARRVGIDDKHFIHAQNMPAATWTVNHNLGKLPAVTVVDSGGNVFDGDIEHISDMQLVVRFSVPFGGTAYCN